MKTKEQIETMIKFAVASIRTMHPREITKDQKAAREEMYRILQTLCWARADGTSKHEVTDEILAGTIKDLSDRMYRTGKYRAKKRGTGRKAA